MRPRPRTAVGSSPLTRGKPGQATDPRDRCGLIPAHAGKTGARSGPHCAQRAHPRSRGENPGHSTKKAATRGSSPLTRGKLAGADNLCSFVRLIPAHAGKTLPCFSASSPLSAHPRSRGENSTPPPPWRVQRGSSPLTRGKRTPWCADWQSCRLIPAHAGKTGESGCKTVIARAHPRSRGENYTDISRVSVKTGSSPLTRGKRRRCWSAFQSIRLIPAHAGKTTRYHFLVPHPAAHPRSRGENW